MSGSLAAYFYSNGAQINVAEEDDEVALRFSDPPTMANDVVVRVMEAVDEKESGKNRELMVYRGTIRDKRFTVEQVTVNYKVPADRARAPQALFEAGEPRVQMMVGFPEDREENGRFDLALEVTATVDGKSKHFLSKALLHVYYAMDVMIVPESSGSGQGDPHLRAIVNWSTQWQRHAPAVRKLVRMHSDTRSPRTPISDNDFASFRASFDEAIRIAHGGKIALAVGHGIGRDAPRDGAPATAVTWLVPEPGKTSATARLTIAEDELSDGDSPPPGPGQVRHTPSQLTMVKLRALDYVGNAIAAAKKKPSEILFHTCNLGRRPDFLQQLANRMFPNTAGALGIRGHQDYLIYTLSRPLQCHYQSEPPNTPAQIDFATHEIPRGQISSGVMRHHKPTSF